MIEYQITVCTACNDVLDPEFAGYCSYCDSSEHSKDITVINKDDAKSVHQDKSKLGYGRSYGYPKSGVSE